MNRGVVQVAVPAESRDDASSHGLWKWVIIAIFDIIIIYFDEVSYLRNGGHVGRILVIRCGRNCGCLIIDCWNNRFVVGHDG